MPDYNPKPNYVPEPDHVPEPDYVPETYQPDLYVANDYGQAGPYCQFCEDKDVVIDDVTCKETSEFVCTKEQSTEEYGPQGHGLPARPKEELLQDTEDGKC